MIRSSILTAKGKNFLKQFHGKERTAESLQQLSTNLKPLLTNNPEQKHVLHLQLLLHVKLQQVDELRSTKCSGYDSLFAADPFLEVDEYIDLIYQLDMHSDFFRMIYSARHLDFSKELLSIAVKPNDDERYKLKPNCVQLYLFTLACMVSYDLEKFSENFLNGLDLLKIHGDISKCEKLALLFQVVGLSNVEDNEDVLLSIGPEYNTLAKEWKFNYKTNEASKSESLFKDLFNLNESKKDNKLDVLKMIDKYLLQNDEDLVPKENAENVEQEVDVDLSKNYSGFKSSMEYLGAYSHLTRLILLKKYKASDAENIFNAVARFSKFKPKTTVKEYNYGNLRQFCQLMKDKGMADFSRKEWFLRLIQFPNCFEERIGVITAMEFLKQHQMDIELIRTLMKKLESYDTDEDIKRIALEAYIGLNSDEKKAWLREFFADEFHSAYELETYEVDLKMMCSRAGSFEDFSEGAGNGIDNDNSKEKILITRIHSLCYQNIETSIEKFLLQTIRSKQFQLLHACRMYCDLPSSPDTTDTDTLLFSAFKSLLFSTEQNTPLMEQLISSTPLFLEEKLFEFWQVYKLIREILETNLTEHVNYPKALSMLLLYEKLLEFGVKTFAPGCQERDDLIKQSTALCNRIECQSYIFAKGLNFTPLCKIRNKCVQLRRFMQEQEPGLKLDKLLITEDFAEQIKALDSFNYALLYVRSPAARPFIKARLEDQGAKIDSSYAKILPKTLDWMVNLSSEEWTDGLEFLQLLFDTRDDFKSSFGTFPAFMREFILFSQLSVEDSGLFSHLLQVFDLHMTNLMKTDGNGFSCDSNGQYEFALTLVTLTQHYCKREEYLIVQQILFNLFNLIEWMIEKNSQFYEPTMDGNVKNKDKDNDGLKVKLLDLILLVPEFSKTSIPFIQAITSKINTSDPNHCEEKKTFTLPVKKDNKKKKNYKKIKP